MREALYESQIKQNLLTSLPDKMKQNKRQTYKNHVHYVPLYHYFTFFVMLILFIGAAYNVIICGHEQILQSILILLLVLTLISVSFHNRSFALKAQDRAIRAEENFRYFVLTRNPLPRGLTIYQIIALRFASDEEFISLVEKTLKDNLSPKQIKQAVKNWKADYYRA
jgi:hypothetical protein